MRDRFRGFAQKASDAVGSPWAFLLAALTIIVWLVTGPLFHFSDTWQLMVNTGTTIVTFLMVFLIQNAQNRDARAMHLKLDELIRSLSEARDKLIDVEHLSDAELRRLQESFRQLRQQGENRAADEEIEAIEGELQERDQTPS